MWYDAQGTDPEEVIRNAFGCFDEDNIGLIHEDKLRELLTTIGDRYRQIFQV
jgi:myosin regulatory light chain 12